MIKLTEERGARRTSGCILIRSVEVRIVGLNRPKLSAPEGGLLTHLGPSTVPAK